MPDLTANLAKLPYICAVLHPTNGIPILIQRGVAGYSPAPGLDVAVFNARNLVTDAQARAMLGGSMFGWDTRSADPDFYLPMAEPTPRPYTVLLVARDNLVPTINEPFLTHVSASSPAAAREAALSKATVEYDLQDEELPSDYWIVLLICEGHVTNLAPGEV